MAEWAPHNLSRYSTGAALWFDQEGLSMTETDHGWDGTFQGSRVRPGVYIWTAEVLFADNSRDQLASQVFVYY